MSVLQWQLPSSSSCFSREAKARHRGAAVSWQRPLLGKQNILIFYIDHPLCCRQFWRVLGVVRIATRYNLYLTTQSAHPVSMPAAITSAVFTWLHLLYTIGFICILSPCYLYSLSPFAPCFFQTLVQGTSSLSTPLAQTPLGASDLGGLGLRRKVAGSQLLGEGEQ